MIEILAKWNRWGSNALESGIIRRITPSILKYSHTKEIIVLKGPRRSGKSTIMFQIMDALEKEGIPKEAILHINFEEPKLYPYLNLATLDELYDTFRENIYPQGKAFIFLDEIQNVPEWERWVRARNDTENIKIFLTGSSAKLMSKEIATLLTGRHLSFEITPLSFAEYLEFCNVIPPILKLPITPAPRIRQALNEYQQWGGFPAVTLAKDNQHKLDILKEYFDDILYKDIVLRHDIRDPISLRNLAIHLLTQTGNLISFQRIAKIFQVSNDLAINYCRYIQEAYMVDLLPFYSLKASIRQRHPQKVYALDLGLRNVVSFAHSADEGHQVETLVYHHLRRHHGENVFYWKGETETDFVIKEGTTVTQLWQVVAEGLDDEKVLARELKALHEARETFPLAEAFIVTKSPLKTSKKLPFKIITLSTIALE